MRKLLELIAVLALLNVCAGLALADGPALSAQPDLRPGPQDSTAGGSASAGGGDAGPATVATNQPITASSSTTTPGSTGPSNSSTSATGPGTSATVPANASTSEPEPSVPDGSAPSPTTSGPSADADATQSDVSVSDSKFRANLIANGTGSFAGGVAGFGYAEDPTTASSCSTAEASPGVPTDVSLGTSCGSSPSTVSEDFGASEANGNRAGGTPSGSACLLADASAGPSPTTDLGSTCAASSGLTPSTGSTAGNVNANAGPGGAGSNESTQNGTVLGIELLPSTATAPASVTLLGAMLALAGLVLLRRSRLGSSVPHDDAIREHD